MRKSSYLADKDTRQRINICLSFLLIATLACFFTYAICTNWKHIRKSIKRSAARSYLSDPSDEGDLFKLCAARIASLENTLNKSTPYDDELGYLNSAFQRSLGKDMTVFGNFRLLKLPDDQIVNLVTRKSLAEEAEETADFLASLDIPCFFSFITPQYYEGGTALPSGYTAIDTTEELADEVTGIVSSRAIPVLDSRKFFTACGYTTDELQLRTDMHWTTLAALKAAAIYADQINALTGAMLDTSLLDIENFTDKTYKDLFLGEYGQKLGPALTGLDDITLYIPKYKTDITHNWISNKHISGSASGSFDNACIHWDMLEPSEGKTYSKTAYADYGLVEYLDEFTNNGTCADLTILILKDSYTAPIGTFLSLLAKNVIMVDLRYTDDDQTASDFIERYDPDILIMSYSLQMMERHDYSLTR